MNSSELILETMNLKQKKHCKVSIDDSEVVIDMVSDGRYIFDRGLGQSLLTYRNVCIYGLEVGKNITGSGSELFADAVCGEEESKKVREIFNNVYKFMDEGTTEDDDGFSTTLSQAIRLKNRIVLHDFTDGKMCVSVNMYQRVEMLLVKGCDEFINSFINNVNFNAWVIVEEATDDFLTCLGPRVFLSEEQNIGQVYLSEEHANDELDSYSMGFKSMGYLERLCECSKESEVGVGCLKMKDYLDYARKNNISSVQIFISGGDDFSFFVE